MSLEALLRTVTAEIAAAERRTAEQARATSQRIAAGESSVEDERALYLELDRLTLLRCRQWALEEMCRVPA